MSRTIDSGVVSRNVARPDDPAVAQHGHPIDEAKQFAQTVAHVEDARSRCAQPLQHLEQMQRVGARQRGGRLVENDDAGVARQSSHNAQDGFARGAQRAHERARIGRLDRHAGIDLFDLPPNLAPRNKSARPGKTRHQRDVLADAQFVDQAEILMNKRDRHGLRMGMDLTPAHEDLARVGLIEPGENLDERRLAGAVLAYERMDLGRHDRQVDAIERKGAEKALRETPDLDRRKRVSRHGGFA